LRCLSCSSISIDIFCRRCRGELLRPNLYRRDLEGFRIYSLFNYSDIADVIKTKHRVIGYRVYRYMGREFLKPFIGDFIKNYGGSIYIIGVDERVKSGYSHIAILTHQMRQRGVEVLHSKLIAGSDIKYAGKSLKFRLENPREFIYRGRGGIDAILVDDTITTGTTLKEAYRVLSNSGVNILFGLTLAVSI